MTVNKTLIFDFDGTLIDSMPMWERRVKGLLDENGVAYPENVVEIMTPLGYVGMAKYFIELGLSGTVDEVLNIMYDFAYEEYRDNIPAKPTAEDTLLRLKEMGYSLNILTAAQHRMIDGCLKRIGVLELFDNIWSSDEFGLKKSDPQIYFRAARSLGTTVDRCTFFDDNITALRSAKQAGMQVIGVYDATSSKFIDEIKSFADGYVYEFSEII